MGILKFDKIHESGNIGDKIRRVYEVTYRVTCDTVRVNILQIAFHRSCPKYGDRYLGVDNLAFANDISIDRQQGSRFHWTVVVKYDSDVEVGDDEQNPLKRKPKCSLSAVFDKKEPIRDRNGLLYCNTAGDPFQGREIDNVRWKLNFKRNIPVDFPSWILTAANKVNISPVKLRGITFPKNTLHITGLEIGDEDQEGETEFSELAIEFTYDELGWKDFLLNQGFNEIDPLNRGFVAGKYFPIKRKILIRGEPPAEPVFLDKGGSRIHTKKKVKGVDTIIYKDPPDPSDVVILERDPYFEFDFNNLPLK